MPTPNELSVLLSINPTQFVRGIRTAIDSINRLDASLSGVIGNLNNVTTQSRVFNSGIVRVATNFDNTSRAIERFNNVAQLVQTGIGKLSRAVNSYITSLTVATTIVAGTTSLLAKDIISVVASSQQLNTRIQSLTGSATEYAETQVYLRKTSNDLSTDINVLSDSYAQLLNLQKSGILTTDESRKILEGLSNVSAKTGASATQLNQAMYGLSQGLSSGVLRAEEFNQVTEPLPGLLQQLDKAAGLGAGGFRKLVNDGKVTSDFFKSTFIAALANYEGAAAKTANNIIPTYTRMTNAYVAFASAFEKPVASAAIPILQGVTDLLNSFTAQVANSIASSDGFFQFFQQIFQQLGSLLSGIAEALPQALKLVDFSPLLDAFSNLKDAVLGIFGDLDLSKPQDLAQVIQFISDSIAGLINYTSSYVSGASNFVGIAVKAAETFNYLGDAILDVTGYVKGFIAGWSALSPILDFVGFVAGVAALTAAFAILSRVFEKNLIALTGIRLGFTALAPGITSLHAVITGLISTALTPLGVAIAAVAAGYSALNFLVEKSRKDLAKSSDELKATLGFLKEFREGLQQLEGSGIVDDKVIQQLEKIRASVLAGKTTREDAIKTLNSYLTAVTNVSNQEAKLQDEIATKQETINRLRAESSSEAEKEAAAAMLSYLEAQQAVINSGFDNKVIDINNALEAQKETIQQTAIEQLKYRTNFEIAKELSKASILDLLKTEEKAASRRISIDQELAHQYDVTSKINIENSKRIGEIRKQAALDIITVEKAAAEQLIILEQDRAQQTIALAEKVRDQKIEIAKQGKEEERAGKIAEAEKELAQVRINASQTAYSAIVSNLQKTEQQYQQYSNKVISLERLIDSEKESLANKIRSLRRKNLTESEQQADIEKEIQEKTLLAQDALAKGDVDRAKQLADNIESLSEQLVVTDKAEAGLTAASKIRQDALTQEKALTEAQAAAAAEQKQLELEAAQEQKQALEENTKALQNLLDLGGEEKSVKLNIEATEAEKQLSILKAQLEELKDKTITVTVKTAEAKSGGGVAGEFSSRLKFATGSVVPGNGNKDTVPAWLTPQEFVVRKARSIRFRNLLNFINYGSESQVNSLFKGLRLNGGGLVINPNLPRLGFTDGGSVPNTDSITINFNAKSGSGSILASPAAQARQLVNALKDVSRGL